MVVKAKKKKVVLASGTFDLLHFGHVKYLEEAKKAGGKNAELIVIVARDSTVEKRKGKAFIIQTNRVMGRGLNQEKGLRVGSLKRVRP